MRIATTLTAASSAISVMPGFSARRGRVETRLGMKLRPQQWSRHRADLVAHRAQRGRSISNTAPSASARANAWRKAFRNVSDQMSTATTVPLAKTFPHAAQAIKAGTSSSLDGWCSCERVGYPGCLARQSQVDVAGQPACGSPPSPP